MNKFFKGTERISTKGDVLLCLSTSGNSPNIVDAAKVANKIGIPCYLFSSKKLLKSILAMVECFLVLPFNLFNSRNPYYDAAYDLQ